MLPMRCLIILGLACVSLSAAELAPPSGDPQVVPPGSRLETLWEEGEFTEGVAVAPDGTIYFSDISSGDKPGRILRFDPRTKKTSVFSADSGQSNGLMFNRQGELIAACGANNGARALVKFKNDGTYTVLVDRYEGAKLNAPNDLVIHPNGIIFFSDPRYVGPETVDLRHMSVYRYEPDKKHLERVTLDITKPNGVILSPDSRTLYVAETDNGTSDISQTDAPNLMKHMTLNAFTVKEHGELTDRRVLVNYGDKLGVDGMTVDRKGHIYAAVRSPDRFGICVYRPDGTEVAYIPTPTLPTNCCFGGTQETKTLYITAGVGLYRIPVANEGYHPAVAQ